MPSYMSPELANKKDYLGHLADIWALGVLLYIMLVGHYPFKVLMIESCTGRFREGFMNVRMK